MNKKHATSLFAASLTAILQGNTAMADSPLGWIHSNNPSAFTIPALDFEATFAKIAVNETIDFLDIRDDLLAGTRKLEGDSGDLSGQRIELHFGLTSYLSAFYRRQEQDLKIELGEVSSINLLDIDNGLSTTATAYGLKWNFFEAGHTDDSRPWRAASLELTRTSNSTDDFEGAIDRITLSGNLTIDFSTPQTFRLQDMEDDGWQARVLYSTPFSNSFGTTFWAGYAENEASSGTGSSITSAFLAPAFEQSFNTEAKQILLGAALNWQITPRMPLQLSYEYLRINDSELTAITNPNNSLLPSFLRGNNVNSADTRDNHSVRGSISYWVTPKVHASVIGNLYSNQFLGVIPHYNNPLSGSFSDNPYGFIGVQIGITL